MGDEAVAERYARRGPRSRDTLTQLMAMRNAIGITRVADITGLDRIGIPVMQAVRPFSLSNAVSQGKGADPTAAAISAILESAESCFAERVGNFEIEITSADATGIPDGRFDKHLLPDAPTEWRSKDTAWVSAIDLVTNTRQPVPFELVHTAYVVPPLSHTGLFAATTTGLAAALNEDDAVTHGILECIERDAIARAHRVHGFFHRSRIDAGTISDPAVQELLDMLAGHGLLVGLWLAPSPVGVPVIWCHLMEGDTEEASSLPFPAEGSAAAFDVAAAIVHAIYEAAQSRLSAISGARDDITRASYPKYPDRAQIAAHRRLLAEGPRPLDFRVGTDDPISPGEKTRDGLLSRLAEREISTVLCVRIDTAPLEALSVVRVIVPELEPLLEG